MPESFSETGRALLLLVMPHVPMADDSTIEGIYVRLSQDSSLHVRHVGFVQSSKRGGMTIRMLRVERQRLARGEIWPSTGHGKVLTQVCESDLRDLHIPRAAPAHRDPTSPDIVICMMCIYIYIYI